MASDNNLQFIREKISHLRNAVMYVSSNGLVKLGNDVVTALKVDEQGQLWFMTNSPAHRVEECEQNFPARLIFYRKGIQYFMEISGKATIVNNDSPVNDHNGDRNGSEKFEKVLVKMSMINIEYTEPHTKRPKSKIELLLENGYNWFLRAVSVHHNSDSVLKKLRQTS